MNLNDYLNLRRRHNHFNRVIGRKELIAVKGFKQIIQIIEIVEIFLNVQSIKNLKVYLYFVAKR